MFKILLLTIVLLSLSACGPRYGDFYPCHDDGTVKPRIVLLPTKDCTGSNERADYFFQNIRYKLMDCGDMYVFSEESVHHQLDKMGNISFFNHDISFAKNFGGADFIVATEIAECSSDIYGEVEDKCMPPHLQRKNLLKVSLRVRVIDLRGDVPTIVLQEITTRHLLVPCRSSIEQMDMSYFQRISDRLIEDFVTRLESVTWSYR